MKLKWQLGLLEKKCMVCIMHLSIGGKSVTEWQLIHEKWDTYNAQTILDHRVSCLGSKHLALGISVHLGRFVIWITNLRFRLQIAMISYSTSSSKVSDENISQHRVRWRSRYWCCCSCSPRNFKPAWRSRTCSATIGCCRPQPQL